MTFNELCTNTTKFGALSVPAAWKSRGRSMIPNEGFALSGLKATDRRLSRRRGKAWPPHDEVSRSTVERPSATRLRTIRLHLFAGCATWLRRGSRL